VFVHCYFARLGFLDGKVGLDYAVARAMYYWQIGLKSREVRAMQNAKPRGAAAATTADSTR
jgi:hypothetical protein